MSTNQPAQPNSTVAAITAQAAIFAPAVIAGVQAAEVSGASGQDKKQAVVNAVIAGSSALANVPGSVGAIAGLADLFVSIFNSLGVFTHKS